MPSSLWLPRERQSSRESNVTRSRIVEAIDRRHPETLADLSARLDITEDYLSRQVRELKDEGVVRKAYVVDRRTVYDVAPPLSEIGEGTTGNTDDSEPVAFVDSLRDFAAVTVDQYRAADARFRGETPDVPHDELADVATRRRDALLGDLKSYCLTARWPGNRVAADVTSIAKRLEQVGVQSALVAEVLDEDVVDHAVMTGVFRDDLASAFDDGSHIGEAVDAVLFDADLDRLATVTDTWSGTNRTFDELLERVMAQEVAVYGSLATAIRSLERAIRSWVRAGELAASFHSGLEPDSMFDR